MDESETFSNLLNKNKYFDEVLKLSEVMKSERNDSEYAMPLNI